MRTQQVFDGHFHVIDPRFSLAADTDYTPDVFTVDQYRRRTAALNLCGGAVVSGSFQGFDQSYLVDALARLGEGFVGVTQLPATTSVERLAELDHCGVRAVRFNLRRGGSETRDQLERFARRVFAEVGWHVELYVEARELPQLADTLIALPAVCIDHLGITRAGFDCLLRLVDKGVRVKASGFGRVDHDVATALERVHAVNPTALVFGTDLPSTRAPRPFRDADLDLVVDALGEAGSRRVLYQNAQDLYRLTAKGP